MSDPALDAPEDGFNASGSDSDAAQEAHSSSQPDTQHRSKLTASATAQHTLPPSLRDSVGADSQDGESASEAFVSSEDPLDVLAAEHSAVVHAANSSSILADSDGGAAGAAVNTKRKRRKEKGFRSQGSPSAQQDGGLGAHQRPGGGIDWGPIALFIAFTAGGGLLWRLLKNRRSRVRYGDAAAVGSSGVPGRPAIQTRLSLPPHLQPNGTPTGVQPLQGTTFAIADL